ncbi:2-oxoacid:acceptor oxidoreductase subunit alpha [Candidatus Roizmanbacteria bacterium]|nr:2-oxoacid:acceptor oxidoreductase subunit alpha [Candidatus Roizmanbacteria bacterium]
MEKTLWKIGGEAGYGIMTTGLAFSKIASRSGYRLFDCTQYPSLIRGGHNTYEVVFSEGEVSSTKKKVDCLICLNKETYDLHKTRLHKESLVIFDPDDVNAGDEGKKIPVPFKKIINELAGQAIMANTVALGASVAALGGQEGVLMKVLEDQFLDKGKTVIELNQKFAKAGYDYVVKNYRSSVKHSLQGVTSKDEQLVITGNESFSLGSVMADCRVFVAYPMTPASSVLTVLAGWQNKTGMVVRHAEDEISVINTAIGASFAGARSAVATSGGGFALMTEGISLSGITETPLVVFIAQRPGPATGMPTWTEQGDLLFTVHSGHGEFPKIVLSAGDVEEMLDLTLQAYNLADIYQTPVFVLSDMLLSESHRTLSKTTVDRLVKEYSVNRGKSLAKTNGERYLRYRLADDGISARLPVGTKGFYYQANSYEHLEDGHTTEESSTRKQQVDKRQKKAEAYIKNDFRPPRIYGDIDSETVFVTWGSVKGSVLAAMEALASFGKKTALIHFTHLYPLDENRIKPFFSKEKRYILVENNSQGQLGKLLRQETGIEIREKLLKYDGRFFWPEEIVDYVNNK